MTATPDNPRDSVLFAPNKRVRLVGLMTTLFIALLYIIPTTVGINGDAGRYADMGMDLACQDGQTAWLNHSYEPLFTLILWIGSEIWTWLFASDCRQLSWADKSWLPIFLAVIFIAQLIYITRHLGMTSLYFHAVLCLDMIFLVLPFNLLRMFIAVVFIITAVILLLKERISPFRFTMVLVAASLIHWSTWLLAIAAIIAQLTPKFTHYSTHFVQKYSIKHLFLQLIGIVVLLTLVIIYNYDSLTAKFFPRLDSSLESFQIQPMPAYNPPLDTGLATSTRFSGNLTGSGFFTTLNILIVLLFVYASSRYTTQTFIRRFMLYAALSYILIAVFGADSLILQRTHILVFATAFIVFLYLHNGNKLPRYWQAFNLAFIGYTLLYFFWHEIIVRPFDDRPSFAFLIG